MLVSFMEYPALEPGPGGRRLDASLRASPSARPTSSRRGASTCAARDVECTDVFERGGLRSIYLRDPDGHVVEITTPAG